METTENKIRPVLPRVFLALLLCHGRDVFFLGHAFRGHDHGHALYVEIGHDHDFCNITVNTGFNERHGISDCGTSPQPGENRELEQEQIIVFQYQQLTAIFI